MIRFNPWLAMTLTLAACGAAALDRPDQRTAESEAIDMSTTSEHPLRGRTIRWNWNDGLAEPFAAGPHTHEHTFHEDGTVTWRVIGGPQEGHTAVEKEYAAVKIADDVYVLSYLAASGYTLTATLNLRDGRMVGFASGHSQWFVGTGTFEFVD